MWKTLSVEITAASVILSCSKLQHFASTAKHRLYVSVIHKALLHVLKDSEPLGIILLLLLSS